MTHPGQLVRLIYASRNLLPDAVAESEIRGILAVARRHNAPLEVTGALLFSADVFVQALEGPRAAVETVFETIQLDPRHADIVVLDVGAVGERAFAGWSMAYAGRCEEVRYAGLRELPSNQASSATLTLLLSAMDRISADVVVGGGAR